MELKSLAETSPPNYLQQELHNFQMPFRLFQILAPDIETVSLQQKSMRFRMLGQRGPNYST